MKTIPELCVKEAEGGFKLLYASKRYRMVYVTDHESEIIRWNRVKAPLGRRKCTYLKVLSLHLHQKYADKSICEFWHY